MLQAETFVFLDSVQFARRSWQQRNRIKTPQGAAWLTVPVLSKGAREQLIAEVRVDPSGDWIEKTIRTITHNYAKAPFFARYAEALFVVLRRRHERLVDLNVDLITHFMETFGIERPCVRSSALDVPGQKADLIAAVCARLGATTYVSAVGSKEYIDQSTAFADRGIAVAYNAYQPTEYAQLHGPFEPFLSALDLLFNVGPASLEAIRAGLEATAP
jgi:hypothetical protein